MNSKPIQSPTTTAKEESTWYTPLSNTPPSDPKFSQSLSTSIVLDPSNANQAYNTKVASKVLNMDNPPVDSSVKEQRIQKKQERKLKKRYKVLSSREMKAMGLNGIPKEICRSVPIYF